MILVMGSRRHRRVEVRPIGRPPLDWGTPLSAPPSLLVLHSTNSTALISYMDSPQKIEQGA